MRNWILSFAALILFSACNQEVKDENVRLKAELDSLRTESVEQDSTISDFIGAFELVQNNLSAIRDREESLREVKDDNLENAQSAREQVISDIEAINSLIESNQSTIEDLRRKLAASRGEGRKYMKMVENLNRQIEIKNEQIATLYTQLEEANFKVSQLSSKVGMLTEAGYAQRKVIEQQENALNTAYYTMGTYKELKEAGVVNKEGGFIGIGRTEKLAENFNTEYFTKLDIRQSSNLSFNGVFKKIEIITNHSPESYVLEGEEKAFSGIQITKPEQFWENSKYLVILLD